MPESADQGNADTLSRRIRFILASPIDPSSADPLQIARLVELLAAAAAYFNTLSVAEFGGRVGPTRGEGLVEQAIAAAFQTFGGIDPHPSPFQKAALLLRGITQGHPFTDGNKRTGFLIASYYLALVGYPVPPSLPVEDVVRFCFAVSAGEIRRVEAMAESLEHFWEHDGELAAPGD